MLETSEGQSESLLFVCDRSRLFWEINDVHITLIKTFQKRPLFKVGKHGDSCRPESLVGLSNAAGEKPDETEACFKSDSLHFAPERELIMSFLLVWHNVFKS